MDKSTLTKTNHKGVKKTMFKFKMNEKGQFINVAKKERKPEHEIKEEVTRVDTWKPTLDSVRQAFGMKSRKQNGAYQYDENGNEYEEYDGYTRKYEGKDINYIEDAIKKEKEKNDKKRNEARLKNKLKKLEEEDKKIAEENKKEVKELIKEAVKDSKKD